MQARMLAGRARSVERLHERLERCRLRLGLLDPALVLQRGYAWICDTQGHTITRADQVLAGQRLHATLAHGAIDLRVDGQG
jgi:exodeoxyribonuclease VII large subunit